MAIHSGRVLEHSTQASSERRPPEPRSPEPPRLSAPLCTAIIIVCVVVAFFDMQVTGPVPWVGEGQLPPGIVYGALVGSEVAEGQWWRIFTTLFVHGGLIHLLFNMSAVWNLGRPVEHVIGTGRFALLSVVTALGSGLLALLFSFDVPTVGASGMILGWAGALLPIADRGVRRNLWSSLFLVAIISLQPGISWQGHLGGFLFGLPCGFALRTRRPALYWAACLALIVAGVAAVGMIAARNAPSLSL